MVDNLSYIVSDEVRRWCIAYRVCYLLNRPPQPYQVNVLANHVINLTTV